MRPLFPAIERAWESHHGKGYDLTNAGNLDIQCKRRKSSVPISMLWEVPSRDGRIAVLAARSDRHEATVTLRLGDFVRLLEDVGVAFDDEQLGLKET